MKYLFTYGTLKKGFCNHHLIANLKFVDTAITCESYQMYPCSNYAFPFVLKSQNNNPIKGEVYIIDSKNDLDLLDTLEDYPILYDRESILVKLSNGTIINAIIYFKNEETHKDIIAYENPIIEWTKEIASSEID